MEKVVNGKKDVGMQFMDTIYILQTLDFDMWYKLTRERVSMEGIKRACCTPLPGLEPKELKTGIQKILVHLCIMFIAALCTVAKR